MAWPVRVAVKFAQYQIKLGVLKGQSDYLLDSLIGFLSESVDALQDAFDIATDTQDSVGAQIFGLVIGIIVGAAAVPLLVTYGAGTLTVIAGSWVLGEAAGFGGHVMYLPLSVVRFLSESISARRWTRRLRQVARPRVSRKGLENTALVGASRSCSRLCIHWSTAPAYMVRTRAGSRSLNLPQWTV